MNVLSKWSEINSSFHSLPFLGSCIFWLFLIYIFHDNWVKNISFSSLYPDQKLELESKSVHFFSRLSSFIAFSRLFSCIFFLFLIFLFNDNRVQNQAFDLKSCYFIGPKPSFFFIWAKKKKKFHMSKSVQGSKNDRKNDLCEWKRFA